MRCESSTSGARLWQIKAQATPTVALRNLISRRQRALAARVASRGNAWPGGLRRGEGGDVEAGGREGHPGPVGSGGADL